MAGLWIQSGIGPDIPGQHPDRQKLNPYRCKIINHVQLSTLNNQSGHHSIDLPF
jgi:hypothetical protein